jgi:hypothetical protein
MSTVEAPGVREATKPSLQSSPTGSAWKRVLHGGRGVAATKAGAFLRQAFASAIITLALAEVSLRIYNEFHQLPIFYTTSYNRFRAKPFSADYDGFHINSRGFKDVEFQTQKAPDIFRILGIGDSFSFGAVPYPNNYLTLLRSELNHRGQRVELINMGIPGTGPIDYLSLFVNEGLELKPNMVLLSFSIGSDFEGQQSRSWLSYSYAATAIKFVIDFQTKFEGKIIHGDTKYDDDSVTFTDAEYLKLEQAKTFIFVKNNAAFLRDFAAAWTHVVTMKQICEREGIEFVVVVIPDEVQVNEQLKRQVINAYGLPTDRFDFRLPNDLLATKFNEDKVAYIDLLDEFKSASANSKLYKANDSHWNIAGNRKAADVIRAHLLADWQCSDRRSSECR